MFGNSFQDYFLPHLPRGRAKADRPIVSKIHFPSWRQQWWFLSSSLQEHPLTAMFQRLLSGLAMTSVNTSSFSTHGYTLSCANNLYMSSLFKCSLIILCWVLAPDFPSGHQCTTETSWVTCALLHCSISRYQDGTRTHNWKKASSNSSSWSGSP